MKRMNKLPAIYNDYVYTHSPIEFDKMRCLIQDSYSASLRPLNWRLAMLENWNYTSAPRYPHQYFTSRAHLWRESQGRLAGCLIRYYDTVFPQIHPQDPALEDQMLAWAEENWFYYEGFLKTTALENDQDRKALLERRGYIDRGVHSHTRIYDLARDLPVTPLPPGFRIASLADEAGSPGWVARRVEVERAVWNSPALDEVWFRGKASSPHYSPAWDLVVVAPDGCYAAFCLVYVDDRNRLAEIDPLGTHPAFRRLGLARAMVTETMHRARQEGLRYLYIQSDPDPDIPANRLYASLGPLETYRDHAWVNFSAWEGKINREG
jgi:ribosomal protein S18 acetylase RimI-like enzyme